MIRTTDLHTTIRAIECKTPLPELGIHFPPCPECDGLHPTTEPHNQLSRRYRKAFVQTHGRLPSWTDAMAHCTPDVQRKWKRALRHLIASHGLPIPDDLRS